MRDRRFQAGDEFEAGGVSLYVQKGNKFDGDLELRWCVNGRWELVILDTVFAVIEMIGENEDVRYPYPLRGGQKVIDYCQLARRKGWQAAAYQLNLDRAHRAERLEDGPR